MTSFEDFLKQKSYFSGRSIDVKDLANYFWENGGKDFCFRHTKLKTVLTLNEIAEYVETQDSVFYLLSKKIYRHLGKEKEFEEKVKAVK